MALQSQHPTRRFAVPPGQELRFELDNPTDALALKVISGYAELFGTELVIGASYGFSHEQRGGVWVPGFNEDGAEVEMSLTSARQVSTPTRALRSPARGKIISPAYQKQPRRPAEQDGRARRGRIDDRKLPWNSSSPSRLVSLQKAGLISGCDPSLAERCLPCLSVRRGTRRNCRGCPKTLPTWFSGSSCRKKQPARLTSLHQSV